MLKRILLRLFLMLSGTLSGLAIAELSLDIARGDPRTCLFKDPTAYYNYEPYRPFFRERRDAEGRTVYSGQRLKCSTESFTREKPPSRKRIFVVGESVAGVFSLSNADFRTVLKNQIPSCDFEVLNCSTGGYDSYRIVPLAEELVRYEPDLMLIFMGNNLWNRAFRKNRWLSNASFRYVYERSWIVRELFARFQRDYGDWRPAGDRNINFRNNYSYIVRLARSRGIPVILFRLPINFADYPPVNHKNIFDKDHMTVRMAMEKGEYRKAVALLSEMKAKNGYASDPYVYFLMGKALEKLGDLSRARETYLRSVTLDDNPGVRCIPARNEIIGEIAKTYDCPVVDIEALSSSMAANRMVGNELIFDNCHWVPALNDAIIQETVRQIYAYNQTHSPNILADTSRWKYTMPIFDADLLKKRVRESRILRNAYYSGIESAILDNTELSVYYFQCVRRLAPRLLENSTPSYEKPLYDQVYKSFRLHDTPAWYRVWYCKGEMYRRNGEYAKALACFRRSIREKPDQSVAYLLEGLTYKMMNDESRTRRIWTDLASRDHTYDWLRDIR